METYFEIEHYDKNGDDVLLTVFGDYEPEEPMVMYYSDGSGHPGYPEAFNICDIEIDGKSVIDDYDYDEQRKIEELILETYYR